MKKKIWAAALICIVVLGMLDGCGPKEKDTDKEAAGNTETEAVEGLHATETETEAQGNLKEDTWYVLSGMYQHKMETEENTAVIKMSMYTIWQEPWMVRPLCRHLILPII